jgi:hypothetical protein
VAAAADASRRVSHGSHTAPYRASEIYAALAAKKFAQIQFFAGPIFLNLGSSLTVDGLLSLPS